MTPPPFNLAIPPGRWIVGVSGGADSVALLRLACGARPDVVPIVAHLNHESRGTESDADAEFVRTLAEQHGAMAAIVRRSGLSPAMTRSSLEAQWRELRLALFRRLVADHQAMGVLLAHHADDRAETTLLRLLRGGESTAVGGLRRESVVDGLRIHRPLLHLRRTKLEDFLRSIDQPWRTDASNASDRFARNRVRQYLATRPDLVEPILRLADTADAARDWIITHAPLAEGEAISLPTLADLPDVLARRTARQWLAQLGSPRDDLSMEVVERLIAMSRDRATPSPQTFPGNITIARQKRVLAVTQRPNRD